MSTPLRSVLDEPRASPPPPAQVGRDWVLLGAVVVAALLEGVLRDDLPLRVPSTLLCVGLAPTLLWRRTHPLVMVAVAFGTSAVVDVALLLADAPTIEMVSLIYFLVLPYALFRWGSGREVVLGVAIILVPATMALLVNWTGLGDAIGGAAVLLLLISLVVLAFNVIGDGLNDALNPRLREAS